MTRIARGGDSHYVTGAAGPAARCPLESCAHPETLMKAPSPLSERHPERPPRRP